MAAQSRPPTQTRPPILITRPEPQASRLARLLRAAGWAGKVHVSPLMAPVFPKLTLPPGDFRALVFTSETAVLAAARIAGLPERAWCVGDRTARVARANGFEAISAQGDAEALATAIVAAHEPGPLLYLRGADTRGDLAERLKSAGIETNSCVIYRQEPRALTRTALRLIGREGPLVLPVFSPRSGALLAGAWLAAGARATPHVVAISPAAARAIDPIAPESLDIAPHPDGDSLLATLRNRVEAVDRA